MKCEAAADPKILGGPRCGKPATFSTPLGYYCDDCIERFRAVCRSPLSMINVIAGRARTEEEIARLIKPITTKAGPS